MKQTMLAAALLLGVGWMLASCGNDNPSVNENPTPVIVEETTLPIEEETVDTLFRTYDEAEYMDRSKDYEHKIDENDYCVKVLPRMVSDGAVAGAALRIISILRNNPLHPFPTQIIQLLPPFKNIPPYFMVEKM